MPIEPMSLHLAGKDWGKSLDIQDEIVERSLAVMGTLRDLIPWAAYTLSAWDIGSGTHRHLTLASEGYSEGSIEHMNNEYVATNPAFFLAHRQSPRALRWVDYRRDWNFDVTETKIVQEFLMPAGFREGMTMSLRLPDGRYTGSIHISWSSPKDPHDEARHIIESFRPLLALVCDLLRSPQLGVERLGPDAHAILVSSDRRVTELPGRSPGPVLAEGSTVRQMLFRHPATLHGRQYLWPDSDGLCHRIETIPCHGGTTLVTDHIVPWPFGLTVREAQILNLVARGLSNPGIAGKLHISPRTVGTHIEHLLEKLDCVSRSQLAAVAVSGHLLLVDER